MFRLKKHFIYREFISKESIEYSLNYFLNGIIIIVHQKHDHKNFK